MTGPQIDAGTIVDSGSSLPPCTSQSIGVTLFDGGAQTITGCDVMGRCELIPDSGVCPRAPSLPPSVGPFARVAAESGCCYVSFSYGRPLRDGEGASLASLALRSDWS